MKNKLGSWQGWLLFALAMAFVFALGVTISSLPERKRTMNAVQEKKIAITGIEARSSVFGENHPREYRTWADTAATDLPGNLNGKTAVDILAQRPRMVVLWAGYSFAKDYASPRGHMYALEDVTRSLRTGAPMSATEGPQPASCWVCKSADVPRLVAAVGVDSFYHNKWAAWGSEIVNPVGCADCHDPSDMKLHISRPTLIEAFQRQGRDISQAPPQQMRSLVCAQCHSEYYFDGELKYPTFPWDQGLTVEALEAYYDEAGFSDYIHKLSRAPILKAQHPDYELFQMGIHAQRGVSCADCHMPYQYEGGLKYSDHHIQNPLAVVDRTCQTCHRDSQERLYKNVAERQQKADELRDLLENELTQAHIEASFAWQQGATETDMKETLSLIRQAQWRWDFAVSSHGASFHAPQETMRILGHGLNKAFQARMALSRVLLKHGYTDEVPMPDLSTKARAQQYIGLDMPAEKAAKDQFMNEAVPAWLETARKNGRLSNN